MFNILCFSHYHSCLEPHRPDSDAPLFLAEMTSEELTARRRSERKQFKLDRARAIAAAAAEAEAAFKERGEVVVPALSGPNIPSAATWRPAQATGSSTEGTVTTQGASASEAEEPS